MRVIAAGVYSHTYGANSGIAIENSGNLSATGLGKSAGILAERAVPTVPSASSIRGRSMAAMQVSLPRSLAVTKIVNTGNISAGSQLAINVGGASAEIYNAGHITGYGDPRRGRHLHQPEGRRVRDQAHQRLWAWLRPLPQRGGRHRAGRHRSKASKEHSAFINLERFENQGLISMQDKQAGDSFEISNTVGGLRPQIRRIRRLYLGG